MRMSYAYDPEITPEENIKLVVEDGAANGGGAELGSLRTVDMLSRAVANNYQFARRIVLTSPGTVQAKSGFTYDMVVGGEVAFTDPADPVQGTNYWICLMGGHASFEDGWINILSAPLTPGEPGKLTVIARYYDGDSWETRTA
jgi:hypothetical protein